MTDLILQRAFETAMTAADFVASSSGSLGCLELHRVDWQLSMLSKDGKTANCWFKAPDAESARIALRSEGVDISVLWPGDVFDAPGADEAEIGNANVAVERLFDEPVTLEDIQAIENAGAQCLEVRNVRFLRTFFSKDRKRMLCIYEAPDAESVRQAQREAGVPGAARRTDRCCG